MTTGNCTGHKITTVLGMTWGWTRGVEVTPDDALNELSMSAQEMGANLVIGVRVVPVPNVRTDLTAHVGATHDVIETLVGFAAYGTAVVVE